MNQATNTKSPGTFAFCPACWTTLSASDTRCRACGAEIEGLSSRPYPRKLLAALNHPIGEVRDRAAKLLGEVGEREAYLAATALESLSKLLARYPDLPPVDWTQFARPDSPITVQVAAVEIQKREFARDRRAEQEKPPTH